MQRYCKLCYEKICGKDGQLKASVARFCEFNRHYHRVIFQYMLQVMENNPDLWDYLQDLAERENENVEKIQMEEQAKTAALAN
ncbi:MAG: hypothetical protein GY765_10960 [bacterium]|nr:hypothetical protein [bacterium]